MLVVVTTKQAQEDAKATNLTSFLEQTAADLEEAQRLIGFKSLKPLFHRKRRGTYRLVATQTIHGEHTIVTLHRLLHRQDREYNTFMHDNHADQRQVYLDAVTPEVITERLAQLKANPVTALPAPSAEEGGFLYRKPAFHVGSAGDPVILEPQHWVDELRSFSSEELKSLHEALFDLTDNPAAINERPSVNTPSHTFRATHNAELNVIFLHHLTRHGKSSTQIESKAVRAYPASVLSGYEAWEAIVKDETSNLALTPNELSVLQSTTKDKDNGTGSGYPLFVNGGAGSGKSSILQYLFASYLHHYLTLGNTELKSPLFLTHSAALVAEAKSNVEALLRSNARHLLNKDTNPNWTVPKHAFQSFHEYLRGHLNHRERTNLFNPEKRITYGIFERRYLEQFGRNAKQMRQAPAELAWHVIRTLIKGMSDEPNEPFDSDDYKTLPSSQQTVSPETFDLIYDRVYEPWYAKHHEKHGLWDNQDLALYALGNNLIKSDRPALAVDEAQDATTAELEVIYRSSLYSARTLQPHEQRRVPLAFAGDPLQTLEPTGFSWEATKANYAQKLLNQQPASNEPATFNINFQKLTGNHRSSASITGFANSIQALRSKVLGRSIPEQNTTEQQPNTTPPSFFPATPATFELLEQNPDVIIVVPCAQGQEGEYTRTHPLLRVAPQSVKQNVMSVARAKGLGFKRVALLGFAGTLPKDVAAHLSGKTTEPSTSISAEHYLNGLYVAATRARERLFILDEPESLLWGAFTREAPFTPDLPAYLPPGNTIDWQNTSSVEDLRLNAKALYERGLETRDPHLLLMSSNQYEIAGEPFKGVLAEAEASLILGETDRAFDLFMRGDHFGRAAETLWNAERFTELAEISKDHKHLARTPEANVATYVTALTAGSIPENNEDLAYLTFISLHAAADDPTFISKIRDNPIWHEQINNALSGALAEADGQRPGVRLSQEVATDFVSAYALDGDHLSVTSKVTRTEDAFLPLTPQNAAALLYSTQRPKEARKIWVEHGTSTPVGDVFAASLKNIEGFAAEYPQNLICFLKARVTNKTLSEILRSKTHEEHLSVLPPELQEKLPSAYLFSKMVREYFLAGGSASAALAELHHEGSQALALSDPERTALFMEFLTRLVEEQNFSRVANIIKVVHHNYTTGKDRQALPTLLPYLIPHATVALRNNPEEWATETYADAVSLWREITDPLVRGNLNHLSELNLEFEEFFRIVAAGPDAVLVYRACERIIRWKGLTSIQTASVAALDKHMRTAVVDSPDTEERTKAQQSNALRLLDKRYGELIATLTVNTVIPVLPPAPLPGPLDYLGDEEVAVEEDPDASADATQGEAPAEAEATPATNDAEPEVAAETTNTETTPTQESSTEASSPNQVVVAAELTKLLSLQNLEDSHISVNLNGNSIGIASQAARNGEADSAEGLVVARSGNEVVITLGALNSRITLILPDSN